MPFVRAEIGTSTRPILQHHRGIPALRPATHTSLRGGSGLSTLSEELTSGLGLAAAPDLLTMLDVAGVLNLGRSTVAVLIGRGEIVSVKIGGSRRIRRADLERYIASLLVAS